MAKLQLQIQISVTDKESLPIELGNLIPEVQTVNVSDDMTQRSLTLNDSDQKLLDSHEITPYFWIVANIGKAADSTDNDFRISFGSDDPMLLEVGAVEVFWATEMPTAKTVSGDGRVWYAVFESA